MSGSNTMDMTSGFASEAARQSFPLVGRGAAYETVASLSLFPSPSLPPPSLPPSGGPPEGRTGGVEEGGGQEATRDVGGPGLRCSWSQDWSWRVSSQIH